MSFTNMDLPSDSNQNDDEVVAPTENQDDQFEDDDPQDSKHFWCTNPNVLNSEFVQKSRKIVEEISEKLNFSKRARKGVLDHFRYSISAEKFTAKNYAAIAIGCFSRPSCFRQTDWNRDEICATYNATNRAVVHYGRKIIRTYFRITQLEWLAGQYMLSSCYKKLMLDDEIYSATGKIARKVVELNIANGMEPTCVVSACLYMATQAMGEQISLRDIIYCDNHWQHIRQESNKRIEYDILKVYYLMYQKIDQLFPEDFEFRTPIGQIAFPVGTGIPKSLQFSLLTMKILTFHESGLLFYVFSSFPSESPSRPVLICENIQNPSKPQLLNPQSFSFDMIPAKLDFISTMILPKLFSLDHHNFTVYSLQKISFDLSLPKF